MASALAELGPRWGEVGATLMVMSGMAGCEMVVASEYMKYVLPVITGLATAGLLLAGEVDLAVIAAGGFVGACAGLSHRANAGNGVATPEETTGSIYLSQISEE